MLKIKHERDCVCVVAGFRWYRESPGHEIGSLLLGLYDDAKMLHHVGVCAKFLTRNPPCTAHLSRALSQEGAPQSPMERPGESGNANSASQRMPGGKSRWSRGKDLSWEPLRPELVVEVASEHMQSGRFRHIAPFRRWHIDRKPASCTFAQLDPVQPTELKTTFAQGR